MASTERHIWQLWWPLALLCVLRGSRWMMSDALPGSSSTLATEALGCGSAAALWVLVSPARPKEARRGGRLERSVLGGALMIAGPLLGLFVPGSISGASLVMALALTPVVLAVLNGVARHTGETLAGRLWPGLAAIAGLLLVLEEPSLANLRADVLLALIPVLTGAGAALFCSAGESRLRAPAALLGAAMLLGVGATLSMWLTKSPAWPEMGGLAAGSDAIEAVLTVLALERLSAARWSAQFAIVPLLVLLEGVVIDHSGVPPRVITGLVLLAAASAALLLPPTEESQFDLRIPQHQPHRSD